MAVGKKEFEEVIAFDDWYVDRTIDMRTGALQMRGLAECATSIFKKYQDFEREHLARVQNYWKYENMVDAEVVSQKPDLPNVSSGVIAGLVRRTARNVVQNTPNVEIINQFDDDGQKGILAKHILKTKIIGDELNSNEMQQNLFASVVSALTLGFDAVCPVLAQLGDGTWIMAYDSIHYNDVFPEPGVKNIRKTPEVFVRRYLTRGEVASLIRMNARGWDIPALKALLLTSPPPRKRESNPKQNAKHGFVPAGYEIITWYSTSGAPFLTFDARSKMLLSIEKNKDPLKRHPVHFLVPERDAQQPLGKSLVALVFGLQEFEDLMLNGSMKLWYKNINPTLVGFGTGLNGVPNMSPGKYTNIPNPNAKIEALEVSTQTLLQYGSISQRNQGNMVSMLGAADQQMAANSGGGMSATPQGVNAQQTMVDITTNNYQKAVEHFFSQYCSYALTVYFQEMKNSPWITPTADARKALVGAGMREEFFNEKGQLKIDMNDMAIEYSVRCTPGSLIELEDEKQLRILREIFVPLTQAMPAMAATEDREALRSAVSAIQFIVEKTIELSGSNHADSMTKLLNGTPPEEATEADMKVTMVEEGLNALSGTVVESNAAMAGAVESLQQQMAILTEMNQVLLDKLGITTPGNTDNNAQLEAS